ncbi:MAG: hypothetical protein HZA36_03820 [Parcubacteria group bacterium]|nr:hypothetical protein [Parcubacteria group bacterium]
MNGESIAISFYDELVPGRDGVAFKDGSVIFPEEMIQSVDFKNRVLYVTTNCHFFDNRERWMIQWSPHFATFVPAHKVKAISVEC